MLHLTIPTPCYQDWQSMTPQGNGRHCSACEKIVVDFTSMNEEDVKNYLLTRAIEQPCGRFRQDQLQRPTIQLRQDLLKQRMPKWKRFLAACLLAFSSMLFSCDSEITQGEPVAPPAPEAKITVQKDAHSGVVGMFYEKIVITTMPEVVHHSTVVPRHTIGVLTYYVDDRADTAQISKNTEILDSTVQSILVVDSAVTKNPHEADSVDCNSMKYL